MAAKKKKKNEKQGKLGEWVEDEDSKPQNEVATFWFDGDRPVRRIIINGRSWAVLSDVAKLLGFRDAHNASRQLSAKHLTTHPGVVGATGLELLLVSDAGCWRLVMRSNHPEAERIQDWLAEEVLPAIVRDGYYDPSRHPRIERSRRRSGFPKHWGGVRAKDVGANKRRDNLLHEAGATRSDLVRSHNGVHEGLFHDTAAGLRRLLACKDTPLNHMASTPLAAHTLVQEILVNHFENGKMSLEEVPNLAKHIASGVRKTALNLLGHNKDFGVREDRKGIRTLDVVQRQLQ